MSDSVPSIGIDFGATNSSMAWFDPETESARVTLNAEGEARSHPGCTLAWPSSCIILYARWVFERSFFETRAPRFLPVASTLVISLVSRAIVLGSFGWAGRLV